jgi:hypothetical protein
LTDLPSPTTKRDARQLGFGCAWLRVLDDPEVSQQLLVAAYDAGIRHFDVARSYGYGRAEGMLGRFLRDREDAVTVATKLGIFPPRLPQSQLVYRIARIVRKLPAVHAWARRRTDSAVTPRRFDAAIARESLETSFRELGLAHIDILLLHDVQPGDVTEDLMAVLLAAVTDGRVGRLGTATDREATQIIGQEWPQLASTLLVPISLVGAMPPPPRRSGQLLLAHSVLGSDLEVIHNWLRSSSDRLSEWSARLNSDISERSALAHALLDLATLENPTGLTVFSSSSPAHVLSAGAAIGSHSETALRDFATAVRREFAATPQNH